MSPDRVSLLILAAVQYTSRTFDSIQDLLRLADFMVRARQQVGHCGFYHIGDLSWAVFLSEVRGRPAEFIRIWEAQTGEIVGVAFFHAPSSVEVLSAPWLGDRETLEDQMLTWAVDLCKAQAMEEGTELRLTVPAFEQDERFLAFLSERGYSQDSGHMIFMIYDLATPPSIPEMPEGFFVRPVKDDEWEARGALQRSVWPWSRVGADTYPRLCSMPGYDPELDLVLVSPEGGLVAFALLWYDHVNRVGEFEPVGTHPEYRGRGLGKALQQEGLRRVHAAGASACLVSPIGGNIPAYSLYASVGFRTLQRLNDYSRAISPHDLG